MGTWANDKGFRTVEGRMLRDCPILHCTGTSAHVGMQVLCTHVIIIPCQCVNMLTERSSSKLQSQTNQGVYLHTEVTWNFKISLSKA